MQSSLQLAEQFDSGAMEPKPSSKKRSAENAEGTRAKKARATEADLSILSRSPLPHV